MVLLFLLAVSLVVSKVMVFGFYSRSLINGVEPAVLGELSGFIKQKKLMNLILVILIHLSAT